jgi:hypothetical protein
VIIRALRRLPILPWLAVAPLLRAAAPVPSLDEAIASKRDLYAEASMAQPGGASYEFLAPLLPPVRYTHADFRHYPIVLSAPFATTKARLIADGSGVNLHGGARSWHDTAVPFAFRVGPDEFRFGAMPARTSEPALAEGWLPVVEIRYEHKSPVLAEGAVPLSHQPAPRPPEVYRLEAFAATEPALADHGVVFVRFSLAQGTAGTVTITLDDRTPVTFAGHRLLNERSEILAAFEGAAWKWERQRVTARLTATSSVALAIATKPLPAGHPFAPDFAAQRTAAVAMWRSLLDGGTGIETPEPLVNHAWRAVLAQNFSLINGASMRYSAGNQYDGIYIVEGTDAALAFLDWGHTATALRVLPQLLDFTRKGLEHHQAGFKLAAIMRTWWTTRDTGLLRDWRPRWEKEGRRLLDERTGPHGLFPAGRYTGDISTPVQAVGANAHGWRALRDLGALYADLGEPAEAAQYGTAAGEFRATVLAAIERSVRRETDPPFIPTALLGAEPVHDPILHSRIGSYWNITIGFTARSGIFPPGDPRADWISRYQETHGGLFTGQLRSGGDQFNFWPSDQRINPVYSTRHFLELLRRDDPERALVAFYGMLAHGFTRQTFVAGEGTSLHPFDDRGRLFYCPPNSGANAYFLTMLRALLVQDTDTDDDGRPDTLRLLCASPRRWLGDGKTIAIDRAPTAFGEVSLRVNSRLAAGEILAEVTLPARNSPARTLLRLRVPDGWRVTGAHASGQSLAVDDRGTVDITALRGKAEICLAIGRN